MNNDASRWHLNDSQAVLVMGVAVIGLGDIWYLPALALNNGGGAFFAVYLVALIAIGAPVLLSEMIYGKLSDDRYSATTKQAVRSLGVSRAWLLGVFSLPLAGLVVISLYGALAGWSFGYLFRAASGVSLALDAEQAKALFLSLAADPERSLVWHTLFWLCIGLISSQGWQRGLWRASLWFGALVLLLSVSLIDGLSDLAPLATSGSQALLEPRWDELTVDGVWAALIQACFTLSVGLGIAYVTGHRLPPAAHTARIVAGVVTIDILFSLLIGSAVAGLLVADQSASRGAQLVFVDLVVLLGQSRVLQIQFFGLLLLLSASSAMLLIEPFVQSFKARLGCSRSQASAVVSALAWLLGLVAIFAFGPWREWQFADRGIADWLVYLGANVLVPLNCLIIASFVGRALPPPLVVAASGSRVSLIGLWYFWLRFPVRLILVMLLLHTSGIMGVLGEFFQPWDAHVE